MKLLKTGLTIAAAAFLTTAAVAQDSETVVRERTERSGPGVSVGVSGVGVTIGERERERTTVTTTRPRDCETKSVTREDSTGSTTVRKDNCD